MSTRRSTRKRLRHPAVGWLNLDCDALRDPERDHWIILYTAVPGTPDHDALRLLNVIGTQDLNSAAVTAEDGLLVARAHAAVDQAVADGLGGGERPAPPGVLPNTSASRPVASAIR